MSNPGGGGDRERPGTLREVTAGADDAGERLDRALARLLPDLSRSRLKALIEQGLVSGAEGTISDPSQRVKPGQTFAIILPDPVSADPEPEAIRLDVLHEDDAVIVVDKPAGMVVHPAPGNPDGTLVNALLAHCGASLAGIGGVRRPGIVHRLDKDTSGIVVAAKTEPALAALQRQFAERSVDRAYWAVVWGLPVPLAGEIEGAIGRHPQDRKRMAVVRRGGRAALTRYRTVRRVGGAASLLECRLATGRTHQIRVHLASRGLPLIGDPVYGRGRGSGGGGGARTGGGGTAAGASAEARAVAAGFRRQALHAWRLGFDHPETGERFVFESELPQDISLLIAELDRF